MLPTRTRAVVLGAAVLCVAGLSGCGTEREQQRLVPSEEVAQRSVESALKAWQGGKKPPVALKELSPVINLIDTQCRPSQKLVAFSVLGATTGDAHRCYAARLTFDNPRAEVRARYVVLGIDPLWVMRYEDYQKIAHWQMDMKHDHGTPAVRPGDLKKS